MKYGIKYAWDKSILTDGGYESWCDIYGYYVNHNELKINFNNLNDAYSYKDKNYKDSGYVSGWYYLVEEIPQ